MAARVTKSTAPPPMIPIARPLLGAAEQEAVAEVLASGMLAQGARVAELERRFASFIGVEHAIAVNSGTAALHLALLAAGLGPGDEVITTSFTFVATANVIAYVGATPVFADIDPRSYNLHPEAVERAITERTRAIVGVDLYGNLARQPAVAELAAARGLTFVEDACQAHGAHSGPRRAGSLGDVAAFSFYPTKNMTTGEGGMITTNDEPLAERARLLRQHGSGRERYVHEVIGFNLRMTEVAAAIGLVQLARLPEFNAQRRRNAQYLSDRFAPIRGLVTPEAEGGHVFQQYTVRITASARLDRDALVAGLAEQGIATGIFYPRPIYLQPAYLQRFGPGPSCPEAERAAQEVVSLPVHPGLSGDDLERVADTVCRLLGE